jgi:Transposase DDE domain
VLPLFQRLLPFDFLQQAEKQADVRRHNSLYSALVVLWLLVLQRLYGGVPLEATVLQLLLGLPASFWPNPCKRVREWQQHGKLPSHHAGAFSQARQAISSVVVQQASDRICSELLAEMDQRSPASDPRAFLLDGSSIRLPHTPELCQSYPPGKNQHGKMHFPVVRILVAHDLYTGLAMRPEFGPMHGPKAVSEQQLLESAIGRLPPGAVLIGDANFGVFSVAYAGAQSAHPVLLRLTPVRAQHLAGGPRQEGIDHPIVWKPSRWDRKSHPSLPADACLAGRLIVRRVQPDNGAKPFLLYLFTTLPGGSEEALNLYGKRWTIETDLRTLKSTLRLDQLSCCSSDIVAKEIHMGIAAYNLVRAVTCLAARQSGIPPRGYSFTSVRRIVEVFTLKIAEAPNPPAAQQAFEQMMRCVRQAKLPNRRRKRPSYPRHVWRPQSTFPRRSS